MYKHLIFVTGAALAITACKQNASTNDVAANDDMNMTADNGGMTNADVNTAAPAPATTSQGFVNAAAASDKFEVESSKLAASQASSSDVKSFASKMIIAHNESTANLKDTLSGVTPSITPDDTLTPEQQQKLDSLKGLKGAEFDSAYSAAQVEAHQKTLATLNGYAASGDNDKLKSFASGMVPTVTAHLNMAKGLK